MNLASVLGETRGVAQRVVVQSSAAAQAIASDGRPQPTPTATGQAAKPPTSGRSVSAAAVAAVFALSALGGLTAMRVIFRGAVS